jgi:cyclophilin family peptidyl-prolyl cis-trans isomerase
MLSVTLAPIANVQVPGGKSVLVPLTATDSGGGPISYSFDSSDPNVQLSIVSPSSKSLVLNVEGTDNNNQAFSGQMVMHLFEDLAPDVTARIEQLVAQGYYNGLVFHRVLDGFVAQTGQSNNGSDTGVLLDDEFNSSLTYTSPGLLAMASKGPDTADAEFFITAIDQAGSTTPVTLATMPQSLDFRYSIFGQLVSGFDTFEKIMSAHVVSNGDPNHPEISSPDPAITITSASLITDTQDAVLRVTAPASFDGSSATITVTATNSANETTTQTFTAAAVTDTNVDPPFLGPVSNQTTAENQPVTFTLTSTDVSGNGVTYTIEDPATSGSPTNVTVSIDQSTGDVSLTPVAGFTGAINLLTTARAASGSSTSVDTQAFTLTVAPTLDPIAQQSIAAGTVDNFTLSSANAEGNPVVYQVVDATTKAAPTNVDVNIDQTTGAVTLTPHAGVSGTVNLLAEVRYASSAEDPTSYSSEAVQLNVDIPPLGSIATQTTTVNTPIIVTLPSSDPIGAGLVYAVVDPTTFGAPANVTVNIDQSTGKATLTPATDFTGSINLLAEVRSTASPDIQQNYNTAAFALNVVNAPSAPTGLAVGSSSDVGPFDGNGYVTTDTPALMVTAQTGDTVTFKMGGTVVATGVETAAGSGTYTATLPTGKLAVGPNTITASVAATGGTASPDSTALTIDYAPNDGSGVYVVPGEPGSAVTLSIDWSEKNAAYQNELGYFIADSADGTVGGVAPGSAGYAETALHSSTRHVLFAKGSKAGDTTTAALEGGQFVVFYLIQNNTTANFLSKNSSDATKGNDNSRAPLAFFSVEPANPDGKQHTQIIADDMTGRVQYNWEDLLNLGDSDFNDASIVVTPPAQPSEQATLHAPGAGNTDVSLNATLVSEKQSTPNGDVGVYYTDDATGAVNGVKPGDANYAMTALASGNTAVLFGDGASGTKQVTVPAGKYLAFYVITSGTTANFLTNNPTNAAGSAQALFSFDAANPDSANHFRWYTPGMQQADPTVMQLHVMNKVGGTGDDFDSFALDLGFAT